jgi:serine/threonine-protein kinase SRPK3
MELFQLAVQIKTDSLEEITTANVLVSPPDEDVFQRFEQEEQQKPNVPFYDETHPYPHPIYESRGSPADLYEASHLAHLADFGSAVFAEPGGNRGWHMSDTYRAPEILMGLPWSYPVDVWSIGVLVSVHIFETLEGTFLTLCDRSSSS